MALIINQVLQKSGEGTGRHGKMRKQMYKIKCMETARLCDYISHNREMSLICAPTLQHVNLQKCYKTQIRPFSPRSWHNEKCILLTISSKGRPSGKRSHLRIIIPHYYALGSIIGSILQGAVLYVLFPDRESRTLDRVIPL